MQSGSPLSFGTLVGALWSELPSAQVFNPSILPSTAAKDQSLLTPGHGSCAPGCGQTRCRQPSWQLWKRGAARAGRTERPPWP